MLLNPLQSLAGPTTKVIEAGKTGALKDCSTEPVANCVNVRAMDQLSILLTKTQPAKTFKLTGFTKSTKEQTLCKHVTPEAAITAQIKCGTTSNMFCYAPPITGTAVQCMSRCKISHLRGLVEQGIALGQPMTASEYNSMVKKPETPNYCIKPNGYTCESTVKDKDLGKVKIKDELLMGLCPGNDICCSTGTGAQKASSGGVSGGSPTVSGPSISSLRLNGGGDKCPGPIRKIWTGSSDVYDEAFKKSGGTIVGGQKFPDMTQQYIFLMGSCTKSQYCKSVPGAIVPWELSPAKGGVRGINAKSRQVYECASLGDLCNLESTVVGSCDILSTGGLTAIGYVYHLWKEMSAQVKGQSTFHDYSGSSMKCVCDKSKAPAEVRKNACSMTGCLAKFNKALDKVVIDDGISIVSHDVSILSKSGDKVTFKVPMKLTVKVIKAGETCTKDSSYKDECLCGDSSGSSALLAEPVKVHVGSKCPKMCSDLIAFTVEPCICKGFHSEKLTLKTDCCDYSPTQSYWVRPGFEKLYDCTRCSMPFGNPCKESYGDNAHACAKDPCRYKFKGLVKGCTMSSTTGKCDALP